METRGVTIIERRTPVTQRYYCARAKSVRHRQVGNFQRVRLELEGKTLKRKPGKVSEAEALFRRVAC